MTDLSILDTINAAPPPPPPVSPPTVAGQATFNVLSKSTLRASESAHLGEALTALLDGALVATRKAEYAAGRGSGTGDVAKKRIGAGYIGVECDRQLGFRFHKTPKEERESVVSPGQLQRHAESGYWTEESMVKWFQMAGFGIETFERAEDGSPILKDDGTPKQIGWKALRNDDGQAQVAGEVDGVITSIPTTVPPEFQAALGKIAEMLPTPSIWESKKSTASKIKKFRKEGIRKADPKYFGQVQVNMAVMQVPTTLFSMLNLDDMSFYFELVHYDRAFCDRIMDRAIKVLRTRSPWEMSPITTDPKSFRCMFCEWKETCHAGPK